MTEITTKKKKRMPIWIMHIVQWRFVFFFFFFTFSILPIFESFIPFWIVSLSNLNIFSDIHFNVCGFRPTIQCYKSRALSIWFTFLHFGIFFSFFFRFCCRRLASKMCVCFFFIYLSFQKLLLKVS